MPSKKDSGDDKIRKFPSIAGGKKKSTVKKKAAPKASSKNALHDIYVNDARFRKAMELIQEDMNRALHLANLANTQHYFLVKFLVERGLIEEKDFTHFLHEELGKLEEEKEKK